ncbi:MAG TPA: cupredoxin domain-containing protein [Actinomycetota bacterium]
MKDDPRNRLLVPIMVPLLSFVIIAVLVGAFSRVLLAVDPEMATPISLAMALNLLTGAALIASIPTLRGKKLIGLIVVAGLVVVGSGVTAMAVSGELRELREALAGGQEKPAGEPQGPGGEQPGGQEPGQPPPPVTDPTTAIVAANIAFDLDELRFTAGEASTLTFTNQDSVPHNVAIYTELPGGDPLFTGELVTGPDAESAYQVPALDPGSYAFQCDVHPAMNGTVTVG